MMVAKTSYCPFSRFHSQSNSIRGTLSFDTFKPKSQLQYEFPKSKENFFNRFFQLYFARKIQPAVGRIQIPLLDLSKSNHAIARELYEALVDENGPKMVALKGTGLSPMTDEILAELTADVPVGHMTSYGQAIKIGDSRFEGTREEKHVLWNLVPQGRSADLQTPLEKYILQLIQIAENTLPTLHGYFNESLLNPSEPKQPFMTLLMNFHPAKSENDIKSELSEDAEGLVQIGSAHGDQAAFAVMPADGCNAIQIRGRDGEWRTIKVEGEAEAYLLTGSLMGKDVACIHRVAALQQEALYPGHSIALFIQPGSSP